jgi:DnaJ like chaperone protein
MNQHHPDKLVARGMPEEMVQIANRKSQEIRKAYDLIREARKARKVS